MGPSVRVPASRRFFQGTYLKREYFGKKIVEQNRETIRTHTHTSVLTAIFPSDPGLAGCPLNSSSSIIPKLCILLGLNFPCRP